MSKEIKKERPFHKEWAIKVTSENMDELSEWGGFQYPINDYVYNDKNYTYKRLLKQTIPLITTEQFRNHVFVENKPKEATKWIPEIEELVVVTEILGGTNNLQIGYIGKITELHLESVIKYKVDHIWVMNVRKAEPHEIPTETPIDYPKLLAERDKEIGHLKTELEFCKDKLNIYNETFIEMEEENKKLLIELNYLEGLIIKLASKLNN